MNQQNSVMNGEYEGSNMNINDIEEEKTISVTSFAQNADRTKHIFIKEKVIYVFKRQTTAFRIFSEMVLKKI
jgi:hypothetical protein